MKKKLLTLLLTIFALSACVFTLTACNHQHSYTAEVFEPTCTTGGYSKHTCSCGGIYTDNFVNSLGHSFTNYISNNDATFDADGTKTATCDRNGCNVTDTTTDIGTKFSKGLEFALNADEQSYSVTGLGTCIDTNVVIPSTYQNKPVTSIGEWAFDDCDSLTSVTIGNGVTSIGGGAFDDCDRLTSVKIGNGVTSIGGRAFYECYNLTSVAMGNSVSSIGNFAFYECYNLTSLTIGNSVTSIGNWAFSGCDRLTRIEIPDSVTNIGGGAFCNCSSLTNIKVNANNTTYKDINGNLYSKDGTTLIQYAIGKQQTSFIISNSVTSIGNYAFEGCSSLTSIEIPSSVTSIGSSAFYNCPIEIAIMPTSAIFSIPKGKLKKVVINSGESIGYQDFFRCDSLTSVTIGNSVKTIGEYAFAHCYNLTSLTIPNSVTSISDYAFSGCYKLVEVVNKSPHITITKGSYNNGDIGSYALAVYNSNDTFTGTKLTNDNGYVVYTEGQEKILVGYLGTQTELTIPNYVTKIYDYAFYYCDSLTNVTIGNSVTSIGDYAFCYCDSLTNVIIGNSVTSIGFGAFYDCDSLTNIKVNANNTTYKDIDGNLYSKDGTTLIQYAIGKTQTTFTIPNSVTSIGDRAFYECYNLTSITIGNSVTSIGNLAFAGCYDLTRLTIGNSVSSIGNLAFYDCNSLIYNIQGNLKYLGNSSNLYLYLAGTVKTNIITAIIDTNCKFIGEDALAYCRSLTSIEIPNSVISIGEGAFYWCSSLTNIKVNANNTTYKDIDGNLYSKDGTTLIQYAIGKTQTTFTIPNSVTSIGNGAFFECENLTSVTIGNSVTSIGDEAFLFCSNITSVIFSDISTWYMVFDYDDWQNKTGGDIIDVTNSSEIIFYFTTHVGCYWYKK